MGQTVYADVLFLINFSMDFLVFYICARLSRRRIYPIRSAIAAALGGAYGVAALFIPEKGFLPLLCDIASLLLICTVAFARKGERGRDFLGGCALFAGVSAILGGVMTTLYSALNRSGLSNLDGESGDDISVWLFAVLAATGGAAAFVGGKRMKRLAVAKEADVWVSFGSNETVFRAMTDTGNMLTDPLSGRGVLICEIDAVRSIFPEELVTFWESGLLSAAPDLPQTYATAIRYIPARGALAKNQGILAAISVDKITVTSDNKTIDADLLIAPIQQKLSAGACRALLPPGFI